MGRRLVRIRPSGCIDVNVTVCRKPRIIVVTCSQRPGTAGESATPRCPHRKSRKCLSPKRNNVNSNHGISFQRKPLFSTSGRFRTRQDQVLVVRWKDNEAREPLRWQEPVCMRQQHRRDRRLTRSMANLPRHGLAIGYIGGRPPAHAPRPLSLPSPQPPSLSVGVSRRSVGASSPSCSSGYLCALPDLRAGDWPVCLLARPSGSTQQKHRSPSRFHRLVGSRSGNARHNDLLWPTLQLGRVVRFLAQRTPSLGSLAGVTVVATKAT